MSTTIHVDRIADDDARPAGRWVSPDGKDSLDLTGYTLSGARRELHGRCSCDEEHEHVEAGSITLLEGGAP
jgi:hypothetical protein